MVGWTSGVPWKTDDSTFKAEAIPAKSDSAHHKAAYAGDVQSQNLSATSLIVLLEDQFQGATPARMDKAGDAQGDVHANVFLAEPGDPNKLLIREGVILVMPKPMNGTVPPPPGDTTKVVGDTAKPILYKGTIAFLKEILSNKGNEVRVMTPNGPQPAKVNPETIASDGVITTGLDASSSARIFVFIGDRMNPEKPMVTPEGFVGVQVKQSTAAQ